MRFGLFVAVLLLSGCADVGTRRPPEGPMVAATTTVEACGARAQFLEPPRRMTASQAKQYQGFLGTGEKWNVVGWISEQYRYAEALTCICRERPFSDEEFSELRVKIGESSEFYDVQDAATPSIGPAFRFEAVSSTPAATQRFQVIRPRTDASCLILQINQSSDADPRRNDFFTKLSPLDGGRANTGGTSIADRLRALESLRAQGLVTPGEYESRRKLILDAL